jgi:AraC-like DNA-binding protein
MKILGRHLTAFIDFARLKSGSERISQLRLIDEQEGISEETFEQTIETIRSELNDDLLGIHVGLHQNLSTVGVIYDISLKAATVEEGLFYCRSFIEKTFPQLQITNSVRDKWYCITVYTDSFTAAINRIIPETLLTVMARELRIMCGDRMGIHVVSPYYDERYPRGWEKGDAYSIRFKQMKLLSSIKKFQLGMDVLIPKYLQMIQHFKSDKSYGSKVKVLALNLAKPELPTVKELAFQYNQDVRTFQRKLKEERITYRQIVNDLKMEIAELLLRHQRFSINDISSLLGYAETAAFVNMFKRSFGCSPLKHRKRFLT